MERIGAATASPGYPHARGLGISPRKGVYTSYAEDRRHYYPEIWAGLQVTLFKGRGGNLLTSFPTIICKKTSIGMNKRYLGDENGPLFVLKFEVRGRKFRKMHYSNTILSCYTIVLDASFLADVN